MAGILEFHSLKRQIPNCLWRAPPYCLWVWAGPGSQAFSTVCSRQSQFWRGAWAHGPVSGNWPAGWEVFRSQPPLSQLAVYIAEVLTLWGLDFLLPLPFHPFTKWWGCCASALYHSLGRWSHVTWAKALHGLVQGKMHGGRVWSRCGRWTQLAW